MATFVTKPLIGLQHAIFDEWFFFEITQNNSPIPGIIRKGLEFFVEKKCRTSKKNNSSIAFTVQPIFAYPLGLLQEI